MEARMVENTQGDTLGRWGSCVVYAQELKGLSPVNPTKH